MCINALSGWNSISTLGLHPSYSRFCRPYQCPFGLELHFYEAYRRKMLKYTDCINALSGWNSISTKENLMEKRFCEFMYQCPFGLELHFYKRQWNSKWNSLVGINALSGWNSISTVPLRKPRFYAVSGACFCRYLSEYSDNGHFSCMLTI